MRVGGWGIPPPPPPGGRLSGAVPGLHHAGIVSAQNWSTGDRLCGGDANALAYTLRKVRTIRGGLEGIALMI
jgi:hypothetical protein